MSAPVRTIRGGVCQAVTFSVRGRPVPKGSTSSFVSASTGRVVTKGDNPATWAWQRAVAVAARAASVYDCPFVGPVRLAVVFALPRPRSLPARVRWPVKKPDLDKLVRACKDALTGILYSDDAQVVEIQARKDYAATLQQVGAVITIEAVDGAPEPHRDQHDSQSPDQTRDGDPRHQ